MIQCHLLSYTGAKQQTQAELQKKKTTNVVAESLSQFPKNQTIYC